MMTITVPVLRDNWREIASQFFRSPEFAMNGAGVGVVVASHFIPRGRLGGGLHYYTLGTTIGIGIILASTVQMFRWTPAARK